MFELFAVCVAAQIATSVADPTTDVAASLEPALVALEKAALAGNPAAWMGQIDAQNAYFTQEQREWSSDLIANTPLEFDLAIGGDVKRSHAAAGSDIVPSIVPSEGGELAIVPFVMSWTLKDEKPQQVKFAAAFHRTGGADWKYRGEHLEELSFDGFMIRFPTGYESVARDIAAVFPEAKAHVDEGFGVTNTRTEHIKLYDSQAVLQASVYLSMYKVDVTLSGWNEAGESIKFATWYTDTRQGWRKAFAHEYGHVATWELGPEAKKIAWWVAEGAAELAAENMPPDSRDFIDRWAVRAWKENTLAKWEDLTDYRTVPFDLRMHPYRQGHAFMAFISEKGGREQRNAWLAALCHGKTLDEASQEVFQVNFAKLDTQFRDSLAAKAGEKPEPDENADAVQGPVPADAALQGIESTILAMEAAVLDADVDAYMSRIVDDDSEFWHEQKYFANDLTRFKPEEFDLAIENARSEGDNDRVVTGKLSMSWKIPDRAARTMVHDVTFRRTDLGWKYAGEVWANHQGPGVLVLHPKGFDDVATEAVESFSEVRGRVEEAFELNETDFPKHIQKIKIYGSMKHLQASICLSYEDGLGGWNEPNESIKLLAGRNSASKGSLKTVLSHEYGHNCTFQLGPKANEMPWWVLEGVAELCAENVAGARAPDRRVESWARRGQLADWADLADFHNMKPGLSGKVYTQGHHMMKYISEEVGREGRNRWMRLQSNGKTMDEATQEVFGFDFAALDAQWRGTLPPSEPAEEPADKEPAQDSAGT